MTPTNIYNLLKESLCILYERYIPREGGALNISNKTFRVIEIKPKEKIIRPELDMNGKLIVRKRPSSCPRCLSIETNNGEKAIRKSSANSYEWTCKVCAYEW